MILPFEEAKEQNKREILCLHIQVRRLSVRLQIYIRYDLQMLGKIPKKGVITQLKERRENEVH